MKKESRKAGADAPVHVYLGPSFFGIIQKGTALKEGSLPKFETLLGAYPFLKGLLVPAAELAEKRKQLRAGDSELNALYRKAEQIKEELHV